MLKLPVEFKTKWLEALRGGEYKQTRESLHTSAGYCCLGVACEVAGTVWGNKLSPSSGYPLEDVNGDRVYKTAGGSHSYPSENDFSSEVWTVLSAGLMDVCSDNENESSVYAYLASLNDDKQAPFEEIADWIETNL